MAANFVFKFSPDRVDFNKDRSVSAKEMQRWIMEKTEEHFQEAMMENKNSFRAVDPDGDGERERKITVKSTPAGLFSNPVGLVASASNTVS